MGVEEELSSAIAGIYDAALSAAAWPQALAAVCDLMRAAEFCWVSFDKRVGQVTELQYTHRTFNPENTGIYRDHYAHLDESKLLMETRPTGSIVNLDRELSRDQLGKSRYVQELLIPAGAGWVLSMTVANDSEQITGFGIHRSIKRPIFDERDERLVEILRPHFERLAKVSSRLRLIEAKSHLGLAALDAVPSAMVVLDKALRVVIANKAAEILFQANEGLRVSFGQLIPSQSGAAPKLEELLGDTLAASLGIKTLGGSGTLVISRGPDRRPLYLIAIPLSPSHFVAPKGEPGVLLFISDPERRYLPNRVHLMQLFDLTAAEAQVAVSLMEGLTPEEIAKRNGVTYNTIRTQLSALMRKTGTTRQTELVLALGRVPSVREKG